LVHYNKALLDSKLNENLTYEQRMSALTSRLDYQITNSNLDIRNKFGGDKTVKKIFNSTMTSLDTKKLNTSQSLKQSMKKIDLNLSKYKKYINEFK